MMNNELIDDLDDEVINPANLQTMLSKQLKRDLKRTRSLQIRITAIFIGFPVFYYR